MAEISPGRYAAHSDEPFVVFLIGMRVNRIVRTRPMDLEWLGPCRR